MMVAAGKNENSVPPGALEVSAEVRNIIFEYFLPGVEEDGLANEDLLFEDGIIDSAGAVTLVALLEEHYNFEIYDEELIPENFASINRMVPFILGKLARKE